MAKQTIGIGSAANDGTGDDLRTAGEKINDNFTELYGAIFTAVAGGALAGTEKFVGFDGATAKTWLASQIAAYITAQIVASAPSTLDTLNELAAALADDPNFATTMTSALAGKQPLSSKLTAIAAATPIADGDHVVGGITITTADGIITAIA